MRLTSFWRQFLAWGLLALGSAAFVWNVYYSVVLCPPVLSFEGQDPITTQGGLIAALSFLSFSVLCVLIVTFRPENRIGWLCGVIGLTGALAISTGAPLYSSCLSGSGGVSAEQAVVIWFSVTFGPLILILPMFTLLPLWFPNGQFLAPRWRIFWYVTLALALGSTLLTAFSPGEIVNQARPIQNPFGLNVEPPAWYTALQPYLILPFLVCPLIANASLFLRYRRADALTRQQLKVFAFLAVGGAILLLLVEVVLIFRLVGVSDWGSWFYLFALFVGWMGYPIAIGVAVLRYRLYDIEVIIRRTLIYGSVTGLLVAMYFGSVILLQQLFSRLTGVTQNELVTVISTLAIAALFVPVRNRVQALIDRRFYRKKYDAQRVLQKFSETVRDETDMEKLTNELVNVVHETMQPRSVSLWLKKEESSK